MRKLIFTTAFFTITLFGYLFAMIFSLTLYTNHQKSQQAKTTRAIYAALPTLESSFTTEIITNDGRTEAVRQFFARYNSPLEPYAQHIVDAAEEYGLDFRLLPAIAMQESGLCRRIPENSHNCWGFGIYGGKVTRFASYPEAITTVTKTLATKYKSKGLVTPDEIVTMYTPSDEGKWSYSVNHFMEELQ